MVEGTIEFIRAEQSVDNLSDRKLRSSLCGSGQNDIDLREFSGECFDFDCLCAFCLGGLLLKREQKEAVSRLLEGKDVLAVLAGNSVWKEFNTSKFCSSTGSPDVLLVKLIYKQQSRICM